MGMAAGSNEGPQINVTPMIDILLVLIITFMIVTLQSSRGLQALVPQPADTNAPPKENPRQVVLTVVGDGTVQLNEESVTVAALADRLALLLKSVAIDVVFIRGGPDLEFSQVAEVIDIARAAGLNRVALMPR
jgi:biopolymer transport protein ExbD